MYLSKEETRMYEEALEVAKKGIFDMLVATVKDQDNKPLVLEGNINYFTINGIVMWVRFDPWGSRGGISVRICGGGSYGNRAIYHTVSNKKTLDYKKIVDAILESAEYELEHKRQSDINEVKRNKTQDFFAKHGLTTSYSVGTGWTHQINAHGDVSSTITLRNEELAKLGEILTSVSEISGSGEITLYFDAAALEKILPLMAKTAEAFPK